MNNKSKDYQLTIAPNDIWLEIPQKVRIHLSKEKVDFIHFERELDNSFFILKLSSDSEEDVLEIPSYLPAFPKLENWLLSLPDFDKNNYQKSKSDTKETEHFLLWERIYKSGVSKNSVYAGMVFYKEGNELITMCNNGDESNINIDLIEMVMVYSYVEKNRDADYEIGLTGFGTSLFSVKSRAENFSELLQFIFKLPDFDQQKFIQSLSKLSDKPQLVWHAKPKANASIQPNENKEDYWQKIEKGIYIENKQALIPWDNFTALIQSNLAKTRRVSFPNRDYYGFKYTIDKVVIFGGIQLDSIVINTPAIKIGENLNTNWPIENFSANICFGLTGIENYQKIKLHLIYLLGNPVEVLETDDHMESYWQGQKTKITIRSWKPNKIDEFYNNCNFIVSHQPDVKHFFEDDYTLNFQLNQNIKYKVIKYPIFIKADYKNNQFVRITPKALSGILRNEDETIIWIDTQRNKVGIGNKKFAHIQSAREEEDWLFFGEFWRDEPRELNLYFRKGELSFHIGQDLFIATFNNNIEKDWMRLIAEIKDFVPFDCRYTEGRQYY